LEITFGETGCTKVIKFLAVNRKIKRNENQDNKFFHNNTLTLFKNFF